MGRQPGRQRYITTKHGVKKNMMPNVIHGMTLLLQFLCLILPVCENAKQICCAISNSVFSAITEFKFVLAQQEEFIALMGLQRLLIINLLTLVTYLVGIGVCVRAWSCACGVLVLVVRSCSSCSLVVFVMWSDCVRGVIT